MLISVCCLLIAGVLLDLLLDSQDGDTRSSETSDNSRDTRYHIPRYSTHHSHRCDSLRSNLSLVTSIPESDVDRTTSIYDALTFPGICIEEEIYIKIKRRLAVPE